MPLRNYNDTAQPITLSIGVNAGAVTLQVASTAGYPPAPFTLGIERGTPNEEFCLCTALTANSFTVIRGYDGTSAVGHSAGTSAIEHCVGAIDFREANAHIFDITRDDHTQYQLRSALTTKGDIYVRNAAAVQRLATGADGTTLIADSTTATGMKWANLSVFPPGFVGYVGGGVAPTGWLVTNGALYSRTTYAALFNVVGTGWNVGGEDPTMFRVPNTMGRSIIGSGQGSGLTNRAIGATGGEERHTLSQGEMPTHVHGPDEANGYFMDHPGPSIFKFQFFTPDSFYPLTAWEVSHTNTGPAGSGLSHNNMQPYAAMVGIIKT